MVTFDPPLDPEDEEEPNLQYDFDAASASDHYTRFPVHDPVQFLQSCIDKIRNLDWLPRRVHGGVISTGGPEVSLFFVSSICNDFTDLKIVFSCQADTDKGVWLA